MSDLPSLVIVGAGGLGRGVAALVEAAHAATPAWDLRGFVDDDEELVGSSVMDYPVLGNTDWLSRQQGIYFTIAIGDGTHRERVAARLRQSDLAPAVVTHPSTSSHRTNQIGAGTIVRAETAMAVNLHIGAHVVINMGCTIGHDSVLDAFTTLHPGVHISGDVHLEHGVSMGTGSVALPEVTIGQHTTVGAGAVVTEDLPPNCTAVGVPARPRS
jgi:sugar O-acyltransferase (sialic acid O-acetyltransferase NeuD family)